MVFLTTKGSLVSSTADIVQLIFCFVIVLLNDIQKMIMNAMMMAMLQIVPVRVEYELFLL